MERSHWNLIREVGHIDASHAEEQASSDEEDNYPSQHGLSHPPAMLGSMYSRIQEDVHLRIPSIDFEATEIDEDVDIDDVNIAGCVISVSKREASTTEKDVQIEDPDETKVKVKENGLEADAPLDGQAKISQNHFVMGSSNGRAIVGVDGKYLRQENKVELDMAQAGRYIKETDKANGQHLKSVDSGLLHHDSKNGIRISTDLKYDADVLKTMLATKIDERNLDIVLDALDDGLLSFHGRKSVAVNEKSSTTTASTDNDVDDLPLLDRLSSFTLSEKSSLCEANNLLGKLSVACADTAGLEKRRLSSGNLGNQNDNPGTRVSKGVAATETDIEQNDTIYIDLRATTGYESLYEDSASRQVTVDESSSGSEEEDWNRTRKNIKANLLKRDGSRDERTQQDRSMDRKHLENKIHDRITKRTYEKLIREGLISSSPGLEKVTNAPQNNVKGESDLQMPLFDIGPLEDKIRSWHQVKDSNHNDIVKGSQYENKLNENSKFDKSSDHLKANVILSETGVCSGSSLERGGRRRLEEDAIKAADGACKFEEQIDLPGKTSTEKSVIRHVPEDSSLLQLEYGKLVSSNDKALLIVDGENGNDFAADRTPRVEPTLTNFNQSLDKANKMTSSCRIEELPNEIRISDNLMVIQADISAECPDTENGFLVQSFLHSSTANQADCKRVTETKQIRTEHVSEENESKKPAQGLIRILSLEEVEKDLLTESNCSENHVEDRRNMKDVSPTEKKGFEFELKTFSMVEDSDNVPSSHDYENKVEATPALKGLVPQYAGQLPRALLDMSTDSSKVRAFETVVGDSYSGEETPVARQEPASRIVSSGSKRGNDETAKFVNQVKLEASKNQGSKKEENVSRKSLDGPESASVAEQISSAKNKKKSKKKNRKSTGLVDEQDINQGKVIERKSSLTQDTISKPKTLKNSKSFDGEAKVAKKSTNGLKDSEKQQIKERVKLLQEEFGIANVIFDEDVSFSLPFQSVPSTCHSATKLMLKIPLQAPGVCSKSCAKNSLSFNERSDAFIGLCTFFVSLLNGSKFKASETLGIPFNVISLQQASIDSELQLIVGIIENEIQAQPNQTLKRGKVQKIKKNFYQAVTQYLNKTDLESVLSSLMGFEITERQFSSTVSCPGSRKLSSFVAVSQDEAAVARIFNLKPSMLWNNIELNEEPLNDDICWMQSERRRNENTCVLIENITSMLPKTIATFLETTRYNSFDMAGLRVAYVKKKDGTEVPYLAAALRGPTVTTVQSGKSFTADTQELASVKSVYMPSLATSPREGPRQVSVTSPHSVKSFDTYIEDPLITYTIGRGRGEREVVNWFGRRTRQASDVEARTDTPANQVSKSRYSSLPERLDGLSRATASASLLSISNDRVVLSISTLVPTVFISVAMTLAESRGLHAVSVGKVLLDEEDVSVMGLKLDDGGGKGVENSSVAIVVFEGENAMYRTYGYLKQLFEKANDKLPRDALTKDSVAQRLNGLIRYERIKQERGIEEFFAVKPLNKRIVKILETMTSHHLSHFDTEVINRLPPKWSFFVSPETPHICTAILVGRPMVELFPQILSDLLEECLEDPLCINAQATTERTYRQQERPMGEIIGLKHYEKLSKYMAHVCCPYVVGAKSWTRSVENLQLGPVVVVVLRLLDTIKDVDNKCIKICRKVTKLLHSNKLQCPPDAYHDAFIYTGLDTVFRVLLNMFKVDELMPDACQTWFKTTQWPIYLSMNCKIAKDVDPLIGLLKNANQTNAFRNSRQSTKNIQQNAEIRILSSASLNIPAELILGKQMELSFIQFDVDSSYAKYIAKVLGILRRDGFEVVALNYPAVYSPSFVNVPEMHAAVRRPNAVSRLNQWLPDLTNELRSKHVMQVSRGAKEAFDAIVRSFQKTESGGVFDDSLLAQTEKLTFKRDDIFDSKDYRRLEWTCEAKMTSASDSKHSKYTAGSSQSFVMPEVNVIILTNVMMRGSYLDQYISENVKLLGFWEELASLGFMTIGARMTSLDSDQTSELLAKLKLPAKEHRIMEKRLSSSNGPIFVLALLKDFALTNFWNTISRTLTDDECKIIAENVLMPTNRSQVEVLLCSMFETLAPNSEVEIKRVK